MSNDSPSAVRQIAAQATGPSIALAARLLTGVRAQWSCAPRADPTVYFANHSSHGDFVLLWASLPADLRAMTRPVAGADYWSASPLRRFIGIDVFGALLIDRAGGSQATVDAVEQMQCALEGGRSLILFPEGTRNTSDDVLLPFKSGLYHLARRAPHARLVPVWIENLRRVLPKGSWVPVPLACSVHFGPALPAPAPDEDKAAFLARARDTLLALQPEHQREEL